MKTDGQKVYEHYHPSQIRVVRTSVLPFPRAGDAFMVPNPVHQAPYHLLTQATRDYWESYAVGHHVVSKGVTA
jgi:hypothetical protein